MVADAFTLADPYMKIAERATEPITYTHLTDCILKTIEASCEPELEAARAIIRRLRRRDLYRLVDETIIPGELISKWNVPTAAEVVACQTHNGLQLKEEDIIVDTHVNNYAMKDQNPIDNIHWFTKWDQTESFSMPQQEISLLAPSTFSEKYVRIYCRDRTKLPIAQKSWRNYLKKTGKPNASPQHLPPETKTVMKKLFEEQQNNT